MAVVFLDYTNIGRMEVTTMYELPKRKGDIYAFEDLSPYFPCKETGNFGRKRPFLFLV